MARTIIFIKCIECSDAVETTDKRRKFCNSSCAVKYNNKKRKLKNSTKKKISNSLKDYYEIYPKSIKEEFFWAVIKTSKGKFLKDPKNLYELSHRTRCKIVRRLELGCSRCGWDEEIGDLHHINGRKILDCHNHNNLSYSSPNCHRLAQNKRIKNNELISLEEQIGDVWKQHYYG